MAVVKEFERAFHERKEVVALLLLTSSAQRRVAASGLDAFLPALWRTDSTGACSVAIRGGQGRVTCTWRAHPKEALRVTVLRVNANWQIDGFDAQN